MPLTLTIRSLQEAADAVGSGEAGGARPRGAPVRRAEDVPGRVGAGVDVAVRRREERVDPAPPPQGGGGRPGAAPGGSAVPVQVSPRSVERKTSPSGAVPA